MILRVFTDGGSKGNPGPAAIGIAIYEENTLIDTYRKDIGVATNNDAEYQALIAALERIRDTILKKHAIEKIECYSDSTLMVQQVKGLFKIKEARMREYVFKIKVLEQEIKLPITYHIVPREKNKIADALVNNMFAKQ